MKAAAAGKEKHLLYDLAAGRLHLCQGCPGARSRRRGGVPLVIPRQKGQTQLAIKDVTIAGRRYVLCRNEEEANKDVEARAARSSAEVGLDCL